MPSLRVSTIAVFAVAVLCGCEVGAPVPIHILSNREAEGAALEQLQLVSGFDCIVTANVLIADPNEDPHVLQAIEELDGEEGWVVPDQLYAGQAVQAASAFAAALSQPLVVAPGEQWIWDPGDQNTIVQLRQLEVGNREAWATGNSIEALPPEDCIPN